MTAAPGPQIFGFLLVPKFAMMAFTAAVEPLRAANLLSGKELYDWRVITRDGQPLPSSNRIRLLPDASIETVADSLNPGGPGGRLASVVVCGGMDGQLYRDPAVFAWLRRLARQGARIGALSDGSYILARAGLLDGYRCTIHWSCLAGFTETFPEIEASSEIYRIDRNRFTASGGTAALDLMLHLIEADHGRELAIAVAEQFLHERIRSDLDRQRMPLRLRLGLSHTKIIEAVGLMEAHLEEPLSCAELSRRSGISTRQMERLFRKYLKRTPQRYYLELRLERAQRLLTQSSLPVMEVALACGFVSPSHFAKCYREHYNQVPKSTRLGHARRAPAGAGAVAAE
ncbi:MAG: GlxA family transcriptional regulator [Kiloniellales bacterium]